MLDGNRHSRLAVKRHSARKHFKHRDTQGINIALLVTVPASGLLRRSIMYRTHDIGSNRIAGSCLGNTEIRHLHLAFFGYDNILRLNIPVDNMVIVGRLNSHRHLDGNADCLLDRKPRLFLNIFLQRNAFHKLHDDIVDTAFFSYIIDIHNIRMHKSGRRLCLYPELRHKISILAKFLF